MNISKFNKIESISLIMIIIINHIILYLPKIILSDLQSSAPLNVIYISIVAFIIVCIILKLLKNFPNLDIFDISKFLGGNILKIIIGLVCCIFVIFLKISNIKDETILKYEIIEIIHINKNIASNL